MAIIDTCESLRCAETIASKLPSAWRCRTVVVYRNPGLLPLAPPPVITSFILELLIYPAIFTVRRCWREVGSLR